MQRRPYAAYPSCLSPCPRTATTTPINTIKSFKMQFTKMTHVLLALPGTALFMAWTAQARTRCQTGPPS